MKKQLLITAMASSMVLAGCATTSPYNNTGNGTTNNTTAPQNWQKTGLGALAGAALGYGISKATGGEHQGRDAAIGAVIGAGVGEYMRRQSNQLQKQMAGTGVDVVLDPQTNDIKLTMPSNITFDVDKSYVKPAFYQTLNDVANTMQQYNQTSVVVMGHTDSDGDNGYNQTLSEKRAYSVAKYLNDRGVVASRISTIGYGETRPLASNATVVGKAQNRRVEIKIEAPKKVS